MRARIRFPGGITVVHELRHRILLSALLVLTALFVALQGRGGARRARGVQLRRLPRLALPRAAHREHQSRAQGHQPGAGAAADRVYDTDAPVEQVAEYYAKQYGYKEIAPDMANNLERRQAARVLPHRRPRRGHEGHRGRCIKQMNLATDVCKAVGTYKAAEIAPRPNRPRVTIQRPYFDVTTSQVVDRTLILMSR